MITGTVKFYNVKKMFGFITGDDGKDYFVHISGFEEGTRIYEGDKVEFESEEGDRGPKAVNVKKVGSAERKPKADKPKVDKAKTHKPTVDDSDDSEEDLDIEDSDEDSDIEDSD